MPDIIFWRLFWSHAGTGILCILSYYHDLQPKFLTQSSLNLVKDLIYTIRYVHCQGLTSIAIALMAFPALNFLVLRWCIHEPKDIQIYLADRSTVIYCHSWAFANHEDTKQGATIFPTSWQREARNQNFLWEINAFSKANGVFLMINC